jgi:RNA polymerase sigma factor (sigma-70 family)
MNPVLAQPETADPVSRLTEHLFRHESARLVSMLTSVFGVRHIQLAEDVVQEALVRAFKTWPYYGIPANPAAWLMRTAKNLALDTLRREQWFREKEPEIARVMSDRLLDTRAEPGPISEEAVSDDLLCLMFACCHPVLTEEQQVALALKTVCGFGNREIARAFLVTEVAMAKRLTRARKALQEPEVVFAVPEGPELASRLQAVLRTLYLLFNEGYSATGGEQVVRRELCNEAIRLVGILAAHTAVNRPEVHALLSLLCLNAARLPARMDALGQIVRLDRQDRSRWDAALIQRGMRHLALATRGESLSEYHVQAAISACHCTAADDATTDWRRILSLYDDLLAMAPSPVVRLNRAVAVAKIHGPAQAIRDIQNATEGGALHEYYLTHAVLGDLEVQRERRTAAAAHFERALSLTELAPERALLTARLRECRGAHETTITLERPS